MSEAGAAWAAAARRLALTIGLCMLPAAGFLFVYRGEYGGQTAAIAPHLWVLGTFIVGTAGLRLLVHAAPLPALVRRLTATSLVTAATLAMVGFYAAVLAGLHYWGRVTSFELVSTYIPQMPDLLRAIGIEPWIAAATATCVLFGSLYMVDLHLSRWDWIAPLRLVLPRRGIFAAGALLAAVAGIWMFEFPHRNWATVGEPLSLSLYPKHGEVAMQTHAIGVARIAQLDAEEAIVRAGYRPDNNARRSNVFVIVSDAMRADHLSLLGYARPTTPYLEALNRDGRVKLATATVAACNESTCGLHALGTSRYVDRQIRSAFGLHDALRAHGYKWHLVLSGDHTNFYGLRDMYGAVDSYFDGASQTARYVNDDRLVVDRLRAMGAWDGQPVGMQFHLMSTHALAPRFDETPTFGPSANYSRLGWGGDRTRAINFYDRGVLQADGVIREILSTLEAGGYLRDAIVVVTGDHGESLGERGGLYSHSKVVWQEGLRVPLLIMAFGRAELPRISADQVSSQIDIAPTILAALHMPVPASWEGRALQEPHAGRVIYFQQRQYIGLIDTRQTGAVYKHWQDSSKRSHVTYQIDTDPGEEHDVSAAIPRALTTDWQRLLLSRSATIAPIGDRLEAMERELPKAR